jgi:bifunctional UDP-N-acetylglucosamine pyrophosphorylase / glucosamine-1-phosphate N-acetyltransferase
MDKIALIVMAAGLGKRMCSDLPKVVHRTFEMPIINHVLSEVTTINPKVYNIAKIVVVTGHKSEIVKETIREGAAKNLFSLDSISFAYQAKQLGTGDAVKSALPELEGFQGTVLIINGDVPLITARSLEKLLETHIQEKATVSILTGLPDSPTGYGRIIRDAPQKFIKKIVEHKDCNPLELQVKEVNSGMYAVDSSFLKPAIESLTNTNSQGEYYLTDIVQKAFDEGQIVLPAVVDEFDEVQGVNTVYELSRVNKRLRATRIKALMLSGVQIADPDSVYIDPTVTIASKVYIGPNTHLRGATSIDEGVHIDGSAFIADTQIGKETVIKFSVCSQGAIIGEACKIGPFAQLRPGTVIKKNVKVGNFVETKNAILHENVSASHLTYLGDCEIGSNTNIGAGTITCNYDGESKFKTKVGENVFIGSNTSLVAPIVIQSGTTVGAGSVIAKRDIPEDSLVLSRPELIIKEGYMKKQKKKKSS